MAFGSTQFCSRPRQGARTTGVGCGHWVHVGYISKQFRPSPPVLPAAELQEIGYAVMTHPVAATYTVAKAIRELMEALLRDGTTAAVRDRMVEFAEFNDMVGLDRLREREQNYLDFGRRKKP